MTRQFLVFIIAVSLLCMGQVIPTKKKSNYSLDYPFEVLLKSDSFGNSSANVTISTNSKKAILIDGIYPNSERYCVEFDNIRVNENDVLSLAKDKPVALKIYLLNDELERTPAILHFSSSNPDYAKNKIRVQANTVDILSKDMRTGKVELEISNFATDSVLIRFPYGGTISSARIWKNSERNKEDLIGSLNGYEVGSKENYLVWSKNDLGAFFVNFGSCHWSADFQLVMK